MLAAPANPFLQHKVHPDAIDTRAKGDETQRDILDRRQQEIRTWKISHDDGATPTLYTDIPAIEVYVHRKQTIPAPCGDPQKINLATFHEMVREHRFQKREATWNFVVMMNQPDEVRMLDWSKCQDQGTKLQQEADEAAEHKQEKKASELETKSKKYKKTGHTSLLTQQEYKHARKNRDILFSGSFIINKKGDITEVRNDSGHMIPAKFWLRAFANHWVGPGVKIKGVGNLAAKMAIRNRLNMDGYSDFDGDYKNYDAVNTIFSHYSNDKAWEDNHQSVPAIADLYYHEHASYNNYNFEYGIIIAITCIISIGICCLIICVSIIGGFISGRFYEKSQNQKYKSVTSKYERVNVIEDQV